MFIFLRFFRIGAVVLALHDASDVFLEAAKVFKYSEKELGASLCFGLFAMSWLVLRLVFFPFWVIRSSRLAPTNSYFTSYLVTFLLIDFPCGLSQLLLV